MDSMVINGLHILIQKVIIKKKKNGFINKDQFFSGKIEK